MRSKNCIICGKVKEDGRANKCSKCSVCSVCSNKITGDKCNKCFKKCPKCNASKLKMEFISAKAKICIECCNNKTCSKCDIKLTENNKTSGKNICNTCINKINREYNAKRLEECSEKACIECKFIKDVKKYFISAIHRKCISCTLKDTKYLSKEEYDRLHVDEVKTCTKCNTEKSMDCFAYRKNNYRNICKLCNSSRTTYDDFIVYKDTKLTTEDFTKEEFNTFASELIGMACFYCGKENSPYNKNGIDRVDSDYNYSHENCVSCCTMCNMMKKDMDIGSFIRKCCEIHANISGDISNLDRRLQYHKNISLTNKSPGSYSNYKKKAEQRNLQFLINKEEYYKTIEEDCVYCGCKSGGVDRLENEEGYTEDNCVPCCKYCNYMKRDYELAEFQEHISQIEFHTRDNEEIHSKCIASLYHELRSTNKILSEPPINTYKEIVLSDYMIGFLDSTCSIAKDCVYIISKNNTDYLSSINSQWFNNLFQMNNGRLTLKQTDKRMKFLESYCKISKIKENSCLSSEYIAGMFDAHGTIQKYEKYLVVRVTHSCKDILITLLYSYYDLYFNNGHIIIYSKKAQIEFLSSIVELLIIKREQVIDCLKFLKREEKYIDVKIFKQNLKNLQKYNTDELLVYNKKLEMDKLEVNREYDNNIYTKLDSVSPKLIFCETGAQHKLWCYYRTKTSSICFSGCIGRCVRILVMDNNTKCYIGIMSISSDLPKYSSRDDYIKKSYPNKKSEEYLNFIGNLSTCVPLQPFGYNCNGGKLLVKLAFSREVFDYWYNKYNQPLLIINTLSINGKSVQYDRLKELKFVGFTKGKSAYHIPEEIVEGAMTLFSNLNLSTKRVGRMDKLVKLLNHLKIDDKILCHDIKKGMYVGWMFSSKLDLEYSVTELKTVSQMTEEWYNRWCVQRVRHLTNENRLRLVH